MGTENKKNEKSCWICAYLNLGNDTLLGKCMWFVVKFHKVVYETLYNLVVLS